MCTRFVLRRYVIVNSPDVDNLHVYVSIFLKVFMHWSRGKHTNASVVTMNDADDIN